MGGSNPPKTVPKLTELEIVERLAISNPQWREVKHTIKDLLRESPLPAVPITCLANKTHVNNIYLPHIMAKYDRTLRNAVRRMDDPRFSQMATDELLRQAVRLVRDELKSEPRNLSLRSRDLWNPPVTPTQKGQHNTASQKGDAIAFISSGLPSPGQTPMDSDLSWRHLENQRKQHKNHDQPLHHEHQYQHQQRIAADGPNDNAIRGFILSPAGTSELGIRRPPSYFLSPDSVIDVQQGSKRVYSYEKLCSSSRSKLPSLQNDVSGGFSWSGYGYNNVLVNDSATLNFITDVIADNTKIISNASVKLEVIAVDKPEVIEVKEEADEVSRVKKGKMKASLNTSKDSSVQKTRITTWNPVNNKRMRAPSSPTSAEPSLPQQRFPSPELPYDGGAYRRATTPSSSSSSSIESLNTLLDRGKGDENAKQKAAAAAVALSSPVWKPTTAYELHRSSPMARQHKTHDNTYTSPIRSHKRFAANGLESVESYYEI